MPRRKLRIRRRYHLRLGGFVFLVVAAFIGVAAFNSQANLLFWTFGLMMGGLVMSGIISGAMLSGLQVKRLLPDHGAADEPLILRYQMTNRNRLIPAFGLVITELDSDKRFFLRPPNGWVMHIGPRASVQAEAAGFPRRRGAIDFNRIRISTSLPFGILRKSITFEQPGHVVVYPRLYRVRREMLNAARCRDPLGNRASSQPGGHEEFFGLREYRHGDPLKMIDWKHTARTGHMVTRELTRHTPPKLMLLLGLRSGDAGGETEEARWRAAERVISLAASVICEAHREGFEVGLMCADERCTFFEPRHSRWHRTRILHGLGEINLDAEAEAAVIPKMRDVNWLVVHAGDIDRGLGPASANHISDGDLEQWCITQDVVAAPPESAQAPGQPGDGAPTEAAPAPAEGAAA